MASYITCMEIQLSRQSSHLSLLLVKVQNIIHHLIKIHLLKLHLQSLKKGPW